MILARLVWGAGGLSDIFEGTCLSSHPERHRGRIDTSHGGVGSQARAHAYICSHPVASKEAREKGGKRKETRDENRERREDRRQFFLLVVALLLLLLLERRTEREQKLPDSLNEVDGTYGEAAGPAPALLGNRGLHPALDPFDDFDFSDDEHASQVEIPLVVAETTDDEDPSRVAEISGIPPKPAGGAAPKSHSALPGREGRQEVWERQ